MPGTPRRLLEPRGVNGARPPLPCHRRGAEVQLARVHALWCGSWSVRAGIGPRSAPPPGERGRACAWRRSWSWSARSSSGSLLSRSRLRARARRCFQALAGAAARANLPRPEAPSARQSQAYGAAGPCLDAGCCSTGSARGVSGAAGTPVGEQVAEVGLGLLALRRRSVAAQRRGRAGAGARGGARAARRQAQPRRHGAAARGLHRAAAGPRQQQLLRRRAVRGGGARLRPHRGYSAALPLATEQR